MHGRIAHQGFALIAVVLLIVVGAVLAATIAYVFISGTQSSANLTSATRALKISEAGLERASRRFGAGTACNALAETQNFGGGQFTIAAPSAGFDPAMNFDNVTPLPAGQCRIRSTGSTGNASRMTEAVVAGGVVVFDINSAAQVGNTDALNWTHMVGAGANPAIIVGVSVGSGAAPTVTGVTVNGNPMTLVAQALNPGNVRAYLYRAIGPAVIAGANAIQVNFSVNTRSVAGSVSFTGVDQATPMEGAASDTNNSANPSVNIVTVTDRAWPVGVAAIRRNNSLVSGQTESWNGQSGGGPGAGVVGAGSRTAVARTPAGGGALTWVADSAGQWATVGAALRAGGSVTRIAWREVFP